MECNAKEYLFFCPFFLSSQGILHQSPCPYAPQQNRMVERKNKHLVEIARTLLLNANLPIHYWGYAVLIVSFLINRMPSLTLDNKICLSIISLNEPLYHVSSRVWLYLFCLWCLFVVGQAFCKGNKCVFLGCSHLQKWYRCYSPITKRLCMYADVTFEETLYFSSSMQDSNSIQ